MNIIDVVIVLLILMFGVIGFKRGVFESLVTTVGTIIVLILAFYLKNPVASFLCDMFPFFEFWGPFSGLTSLNIVLYQLLAFLIVCVILYALLNALIRIRVGLKKF